MEIYDLPLKYVIGLILTTFFGVWLVSICFKGNTKKQVQKRGVRKSTRTANSTKENLQTIYQDQSSISKRTRSSTRSRAPSRKSTAETSHLKENTKSMNNTKKSTKSALNRSTEAKSGELSSITSMGRKRVTRSSRKS